MAVPNPGWLASARKTAPSASSVAEMHYKADSAKYDEDFAGDVEESDDTKDDSDDTATDTEVPDPRTQLDAKVHPMHTNCELLEMMVRASMYRKDRKKNLCSKAPEVFTTRGELKLRYWYLISPSIGRNPEDVMTLEEQQRIIITVP
jgi:hypothetical protein